jgi:putative cardiolipin synthase
MKMKFFILLGVLLAIGCVSSDKSKQLETHNQEALSRNPASLSDFFEKIINGKSILTDDEILSASSAQLKFKRARVIVDNDAAFDSKIQIIDSAKKSLKLSYYIFQDDYTSSLMIQKLIKKAQEGVKVQILVDYLTNYKKMPLFEYMMAQGKNNLEVRFYGKPTSAILRDIAYMSMPCPDTSKPDSDTCQRFKNSQLSRLGIDGSESNRRTTYFSKLLLSGLYGKNPDLIYSGLLIGGGIDLKKYKESGSATPEQKEDLKEFLQLLFQATVKNDFVAQIKVKIALLLYSEDLNPIMNEISGRLPLIQEGTKSGRDWDHITDFIHHKIILADNQFFQIGGRNIEDSYHMKQSELSSKYTFMDTDLWAEIQTGGDRLNFAFDKLYNFSPMVAKWQDATLETPAEFILNAKLIKQSLTQCLEKKVSYEELPNCERNETLNSPSYVSQQASFQKIREQLSKNVKTYTTQYLPIKKYTHTWKAGEKYSDQIDNTEIQNMSAYYIENLNYNKDAAEPVRLFGSVYESEERSGKYIHSLWFQGMLNACHESAKSNTPTDVYLHSAYLLPPAGLMRTFAQMMNGNINCGQVRLTILTNSVQTTDLSPINILAQYQLNPLFRIHEQKRSWFGSITDGRSAQMKIFEYKPSALGKGVSLHTKVSILGKDAIVGSANGDVRSYYMDTNNGVYLRNVPAFNQQYVAWLNSKTQNTSLTSERTEDFARLNIEEARKRNEQIVNYYLTNRPKPIKVNPKWITFGLDKLDVIGADIEANTLRILAPEMYQVSPGNQLNIMTQFDKKFKLL